MKQGFLKIPHTVTQLQILEQSVNSLVTVDTHGMDQVVHRLVFHVVLVILQKTLVIVLDIIQTVAEEFVQVLATASQIGQKHHQHDN